MYPKEFDSAVNWISSGDKTEKLVILAIENGYRISVGYEGRILFGLSVDSAICRLERSGRIKFVRTETEHYKVYREGEEEERDALFHIYEVIR